MTRVVAVIQARTGSTRFPGKVLEPIMGKPMLFRQLERVKKSERIDDIVLATTDKATDDAVAKIGKECNVHVFRGSESDVLDRYYQAAKNAHADIVVRITGDCPLHDPRVIDEVVTHFLSYSYDYLMQPRNYMEGVDTEVCSFKALERAWREAQLPSEREHVMPFIRNHPEIFSVQSEWRTGADDNSSIHASVDTLEDLQFVTAIYNELYTPESVFSMADVIALVMRKPGLLEINKGSTGFEGYEKSLREDDEWRKNHG